jgi:hypothetical protein
VGAVDESATGSVYFVLQRARVKRAPSFGDRIRTLSLASPLRSRDSAAGEPAHTPLRRPITPFVAFPADHDISASSRAGDGDDGEILLSALDSVASWLPE